MSDIGNGSGVTATSMFAANATGEAIVVVPKGTTIPLPDYQILNSFIANKNDTIFTVPATGQYVIYYTLSLTAGLDKLGARLLLNGCPIPASIITPAAVSTSFLLTFITNLEAGDTLESQLFGINGVVVLNEGVGAALTVVQLS